MSKNVILPEYAIGPQIYIMGFKMDGGGMRTLCVQFDSFEKFKRSRNRRIPGGGNYGFDDIAETLAGRLYIKYGEHVSDKEKAPFAVIERKGTEADQVDAVIHDDTIDDDFEDTPWDPAYRK